uniref:Foot protein-3 variant4 n=1 Tax=Mytilus edulis TaxID=6550 RepID=Q9NAU9_MYTED|nr:foot protein-3 precursor variant4 [Mytilus edulis]
MNNFSVSVLVALVLIGSFAVQSDASDYYGPIYGPSRRYRGGNYNRYNRYGGGKGGYGGYKGWNNGWGRGSWGRRKYNY